MAAINATGIEGAGRCEADAFGFGPEVGCGDKPRGFFTEFGAPAPGAPGDKPPGFITTERLDRVPELGEVSQQPLRGGRPTVFTPQLQERLCMLLSVGLSRRQAAAYLNIDHTTITRAVARDAELAACVKGAEDQATVQPMLTVISASRKHWRAAAWLLKYKDRQPAELTPDEQEQQHAERLARERRSAECMHEWMNSLETQATHKRPAADKGRRSP